MRPHWVGGSRAGHMVRVTPALRRDAAVRPQEERRTLCWGFAIFPKQKRFCFRDAHSPSKAGPALKAAWPSSGSRAAAAPLSSPPTARQPVRTPRHLASVMRGQGRPSPLAAGSALQPNTGWLPLSSRSSKIISSLNSKCLENVHKAPEWRGGVGAQPGWPPWGTIPAPQRPVGDARCRGPGTVSLLLTAPSGTGPGPISGQRDP